MDALLETLALVVIAYFAALNGTYALLAVVAWRDVLHELRARAYDGADELLASPLTPPISVLLAAYNEEVGVVNSVRSLLALNYPEYEVILVNDGSTDETLPRLVEAFDLVPAHRALRNSVATAPIRGTYVSRLDPRLCVVDKENGRRADALNAGVIAARYPYFCQFDADCIIEDDALLRIARPVIDDPERVIAVGGIVRVGNGCAVEGARVRDVRLPESTLGTLQVIEYLRSFLIGRVAWSRLRSLCIISGAFGLFRRSAVEQAGGYATDTLAEDMELTVRLHRSMRERGVPYRVAFVPDPVVWTEAPESLGSLARQRRRWQRGLAEVLWRHRRMILNPHHRGVGMLALPFFVVFELLSPFIQLASLAIFPVLVALGQLDAAYLAAFLAVAVLLGMFLSLSALLLEEFSFRRYRRHRDLVRMVALAFVENLGYRQLVDVFRLHASLQVVLGARAGWGAMPRIGLARPAAD